MNADTVPTEVKRLYVKCLLLSRNNFK